eukprot:13337593-Alexandrium_andersonii.AAC.1
MAPRPRPSPSARIQRRQARPATPPRCPAERLARDPGNPFVLRRQREDGHARRTSSRMAMRLAPPWRT